MNAKKQNNSWNLILDLWETHLNNPKFSNDTSEITINSKKFQTVEKVIVSHSFILNNLKKLLTIDPSLYGEINETQIGLEEFTKNTISKKFSLPKKPRVFQRRTDTSHIQKQDVEKTQHILSGEIEISETTDLEKNESISKLLPFSQKTDSTKKETPEQKSSNYFTNKNILKGFAVALPIILLTFLIRNTLMNRSDHIQGQTRAIKKDKKRDISNKKRTTSSRKSNKLKKSRTLKKTTYQKSKPAAKRQIAKKSKNRRKRLLEQRTRKMPASLDENQENINETIDTEQVDPYDQELANDQKAEDETIVDTEVEEKYAEEKDTAGQDELSDEIIIDEENYQEEDGQFTEDPSSIEAPNTDYME